MGLVTKRHDPVTKWHEAVTKRQHPVTRWHEWLLKGMSLRRFDPFSYGCFNVVFALVLFELRYMNFSTFREVGFNGHAF
jgi:hypothetical protein